ncbi:TPA: hypothetical protein WIV41_000797 [Neisseria meningitidis]|uniref:hypothetical protein n=1 Tax=Neisseria meningitidis TaxID=487 RepID=UPI00117FB01B|nr:hypothetical protein [Neisseria meningitidis]
MPSEAFRRHFQHRNFKEKEPIPPFPRKTENQKRNLKSVIPEQTGIQSVRFPFFFFFEFRETSQPPFPQKRKKSKTEISSFPRRRESRNSKLQEFIKND